MLPYTNFNLHSSKTQEGLLGMATDVPRGAVVSAVFVDMFGPASMLERLYDRLLHHEQALTSVLF